MTRPGPRGGRASTAQRATLAKRIAALDAELADLGAAAPARRGRPVGSKNRAKAPRKLAKNTLSLHDILAAAVSVGAVVSPADAAKAVKARGYRTADKNFGQTVARTLAAHKGFKRKGRGQYVRVGASRPPTRGKAAKRASATSA